AWLGQPLGPRPSRLACRMLGDVGGAAWPDLRYPWRRHRSRLSASRKRNRAIALHLSYAGDGELLDAQRLPSVGRKENGEVGRQLRHHPRPVAQWVRQRFKISNVSHSLSSTY